jgi:tRNA pseudouridine38-40 synthase
VFDRRYVLWHPRPLDLDAMAAAARQLVGRRDFASFASQAARQHSTVRDLRRLDLVVRGDHLHCTFEADGFLYNMVRAITGTLLEVGRGRRRPGELTAILAARCRQVAGENAPARGLCLVRVHYREEAFR